MTWARPASHLSMSQSREARGVWHGALPHGRHLSWLMVTTQGMGGQFWGRARLMEMPLSAEPRRSEGGPRAEATACSPPRPHAAQSTRCFGLRSAMLVWFCLPLFLNALSNHFQLKGPTEKSSFLPSLKNPEVQAMWQQ